MKRNRQLLLFIALIFIGLTFFFPLWKITLKAPQYPTHDLGMYIYLNDIKPIHTNDLKNINILNHYIGMKEIVKEEFIEFKYMPMIFFSILFLGLIALLINRRSVLIFWFTYVISACLIGLYDFYIWEYNFGHNLDPNAAIKIPGMSYQPPFLGTQTLLSIEASSYPSLGSLCLFIGLTVAIIAIFFYKEKKNGLKK
jgi:copper chaperone NosL